MNISRALTDEAILTELGRRIQRCRIDLELTQADLAEQAGLSKRTVERLEDGGSAQMSSIVRVLRALDLLRGLEALVPETGPRPTEMLRRKGKLRKRASSKRRADRTVRDWSWGDES